MEAKLFPQNQTLNLKILFNLYPICLRFDHKEMSGLIFFERRSEDTHLRGYNPRPKQGKKWGRETKKTKQIGTAGSSLLGLLIQDLILLSNICTWLPLFIKSMKTEFTFIPWVPDLKQSSHTKLDQTNV